MPEKRRRTKSDSYDDQRQEQPCPCGSRQSYQGCCMPYHHSKAKAKTAEQLMRSRYSAYYHRRADYLVETTHPDTREPNLAKKIKQGLHDVSWQGLTVIQSSKGGLEDKTGKVEFVARYRLDGEMHEMHEVSRFRRYKGQWKYLDGKVS